MLIFDRTDLYTRNRSKMTSRFSPLHNFVVSGRRTDIVQKIFDPHISVAELREICLALLRIIYPCAVTQHRMERNDIVADGQE